MENKKRLIYADDIVKVAEHAFNEWNLAMAAADGDREINHVFKMQELCKAVKAVAENAPTVDAVELPKGKPGDYLEWDNGAGFTRMYYIHSVMICEDCIRYDLDTISPVISHPHIVRILTREEAEAALDRMKG